MFSTFKITWIISFYFVAFVAAPPPPVADDNKHIDTSQTVLTLTKSLVQIKKVLGGVYINLHFQFVYTNNSIYAEMNEKLNKLIEEKKNDKRPDIFSVYLSDPAGIGADSVVHYDHVNTDSKGLVDLGTGTFTVQIPGIYQLSFQGMSHQVMANGSEGTLVELKVNGVSRGASFASPGMRNAVTILTVLRLNRADKVNVHVRQNGLYEYPDASIYFTHFNGQLLHDESSGQNAVNKEMVTKIPADFPPVQSRCVLCGSGK